MIASYLFLRRKFNPLQVPSLPKETPGWPWGYSTQKQFLLEIGAGAGVHAIKYCQEHADQFLIALERTRKFEQLQRRLHLEKTPLPNLCAIRADAVPWVSTHVKENYLHKIFILYPNPYPKMKQRNLRWHQMPFMGFLISRLKLTGQLVLATNLLWYADEAEEYLTKVWGLKLLNRTVLKDPVKARTHFEKKYLERQETCVNLIFQRIC
ncbi:MAG: hypothetical protein K1X29_10185 [Bdellovibrionales bacterium]|nr:hypothetical protein [Bdellovibrionales bacterium]